MFSDHFSTGRWTSPQSLDFIWLHPSTHKLWSASLSLLNEKHSNMLLPPPCFTAEMCVWSEWLALFLPHVTFCIKSLKVQFWSHQIISFYMFAVSLTLLAANNKLFQQWLSCGSLQLPLVASQINPVFAQPVSLGGRPCPSRFTVVPYFFHFQVIDLFVLCDMFKAWDIFLYKLTLLYTSLQHYPWPVVLHDTLCLLMFHNKPLRPSHNCCIYIYWGEIASGL